MEETGFSVSQQNLRFILCFKFAVYKYSLSSALLSSARGVLARQVGPNTPVNFSQVEKQFMLRLSTETEISLSVYFRFNMNNF